MKNLKHLFVLVSLIILQSTIVNHQSNAQGISKGNKKVYFTFPDSLTNSYAAIFPTYCSQSEPEITAVAIDCFYTKVVLDTVSANSTLNMSTVGGVTAGAQAWVFYTPDDDGLTLTFGTGVDGTTYTTVLTDSLKTLVIPMFYDGSIWFVEGSPARID